MKIARVAIAATAAFTVLAAQADTLVIDFDFLGPTFDYTATLATPSQSITVSPFLVANQTTTASFVAFCIEPFVPLSASSAMLPGNATYSSATPYNAVSVQALYNGYYGNALSNGTEAAAFQFALWELVAEFTLSPNLTNGNFAFANAADPAVVRGQQMLAGIGAATNIYSLSAYTTSNANLDRSQNVLTAVLVPEPGTYAMMVAGLALVGAAAARRRRSA